MFAGRQFQVAIEGFEHFHELASRKEGFVILSSHMGCYEVAGYSLTSANKTFNALVYGGEKASVMEGRQAKFMHNNIRMIPVSRDMSHLFRINEALSNNEIVSMPADRIVGSTKKIEVDLLGAKAHLPQGPFSVATMRELDVLAVSVMKTSSKGYQVYVTPLCYDKAAPRKTQIQQLADSYAHELERRLCQYPEQWYNFFDFWS